MSTITFDFRHHYQRGERRESEQIAYQWDLGHVMEVFVPEDATYTIGYCFGDYEKTEDYAIDTKVQDPDGSYKLTAHIPNKYFERSRELRVYVVGSADDHIITTYEGFIPIRGRLQPDDYVDDDPENGATQIIEVAREYATKSESFAVGGTGTRLGEDTDNAKYYLEQAEAVAESIPEDYSELSDDVDQLKNALTTKAEQDGAYPDLTAGQLLSKNEASDSVPYNFRAVGQNATLEYTDAIVGGSVVKNQLVQNGNFANANGWVCNFGTIVVASNELTFTSDGRNVVGATYRNAVFASNHKVLVSFEAKGDFHHVRVRRPFQSVDTVIGSTYRTYSFIGNVNGQDQVNLETVMIQGVLATAEASKTYSLKNVCAFDLTQMFGTTIADYIYTLETDTAGSGVVWLKEHFPKIFDAYQEYNTGEIVSVQGLSQHVTVGWNQFDKSIANIDKHLDINGNITYSVNSGTSDYIRVLPNKEYYCANIYGTSTWYSSAVYDSEKNFIEFLNISGSGQSSGILTMPRNAAYLIVNFPLSAIDSVCVSISDPVKNGTYEPYQKRTYPLDSTKTFRGIFKLDSNNQLYADGDRYLPDGTVQRRYGERAYQSEDVTDGSTMITDGTNTVYKRTTPTTETADPYTVPQIVDPNGTEEYLSTSIVPVGHESRYPVDLRVKLDGLPWDLSMIAPIENGDKASQAYAVGKYFLHNNQFCKAKIAIAANATFTLNTNYEVTTVADEIYSALH